MSSTEAADQHLLGDIAPQPLGPEHIPDIARLHHRELWWSFNGRFGEAHIAELYRAVFESREAFGYVYYHQSRLIGFATGTLDSDATRRAVTSVFKGKLGRTVAILLRRPKFIAVLLESRFIVPGIFRRHHTKAEWLTLVTDTEAHYLSAFVALKLIDSIRLHFKSSGVGVYLGQTIKDNPRALRLYARLRWHVAARLFMHNVYSFSTE